MYRLPMEGEKSRSGHVVSGLLCTQFWAVVTAIAITQVQKGLICFLSHFASLPKQTIVTDGFFRWKRVSIFIVASECVWLLFLQIMDRQSRRVGIPATIDGRHSYFETRIHGSVNNEVPVVSQIQSDFHRLSLVD
jgi:hypothetical protein